MKKSLWEKIKGEFDELTSKINPAPATAAAAPAAAAAAAPVESKKKDKDEDEDDDNDGDDDGDARAELPKLTAKVDELTKSVQAKDQEITNLKAEVTKLKGEAKSAGEQAVDMVAATGIPAEQLPAAAKPGNAGQATKSLMAQYRDLLATDSVKAAAFYAEHSNKPEFWK